MTRISNMGSGGAATSGVTLVAAGANLTGGTITSAGTIALAGTIQPTMIGTTTIQGGTANALTLGTPTVQFWDAWQPITGALAYVSGSVFTIVGDYTSYIQKTDKLKLVQGGTTEYFNILGAGVASGTTTGTVIGDVGTPVANAAITSGAFSKGATPQGFPDVFNYTPVWTAAGANPTIGNGALTGKYAIHGKTCWMYAKVVTGTSTTYGTGTYYLSPPIPSTGNTSDSSTGGVAVGARTGVLRYFGVTDFETTTTISVNFALKAADYWAPTNPWTFTTGDIMTVTANYPI